MKRILFGFLFSTLVSQVSLAQSTIDIFGNAVPETNVVADPHQATLGVKFYSQVPGTISGIRFYRGYTNTHGYNVRLYTTAGSQLGGASTARDTCAVPCWESINFASPIPISANTTYIAAYYTNNGEYATDDAGFANGAMNGPLVVPASGVSGGNGVYTYSTGFPNQTDIERNYWVDVLFESSAPVLRLTFNPPNPSLPVNSPIGTPIASAVATWSDGSQFTGSYGLVNNGNGICAISGNQITLEAALPSSDALHHCIVSATQ